METFDGTSFLLIGTGLLVSLLVIQIIWTYQNTTGSGSASASGAMDSTPASGDGMVPCPECSKPTEAEYRYCRHCAEDTGRSYLGSSGAGDSNRSGML
ncbi:MAG: hypothetical protein U5J64_01445 [Halobacteriales archaeon]|nr:hypothetical protein [Halobacteriales archaeon]